MSIKEYKYYILPKELRNDFLLVSNKLDVSRQAIKDPTGYYYQLIKANYNPKAIENIPVKLAKSHNKSVPLFFKRILFLKRHLQTFNKSHHRQLLSLIAWAYKPDNITEQTIKQTIFKNISFKKDLGRFKV